MIFSRWFNKKPITEKITTHDIVVVNRYFFILKVLIKQEYTNQIYQVLTVQMVRTNIAGSLDYTLTRDRYTHVIDNPIKKIEFVENPDNGSILMIVHWLRTGYTCELYLVALTEL